MSTAARGSRRNNTQRRQPVSISGPSPLTIQRRQRSRSPDPQPAQQLGQLNSTRKPDTSHADQNKRKRPTNPSLPSSSSRPFLIAIDDPNSDRGRKSNTKPRSHTRPLAENASRAGTSRVPETHTSVPKGERSRELPILPTKGTTSDVEGSGRDAHATVDAHIDYTGPLAAAEFAKIKRELDVWKKSTHENKKTIKKQSKAIEEFKQQDNILRKKLKEVESQLLKLQSKSKKADEVIATVESNSQCQICMELLYRPYALSPCGHILCVTCLQEWFRKAPVVDDDMDDDGDPDYLLRRRKTCPCCRTNIRHRPIPVFMIKSIVAAIAKVKGPQGTSPGREQAPNDSDPWEGLFPEDEEEIDDYGATDDEDEDLDEDDEEDSSFYDEVFSYGTGSEEEAYQGRYVFPQWEPPNVVIDEDDYLFEGLEEDDLKCLQRGVTIGMLHKYDVEYRHEEGLIARDEAYNRIYLGWKISLSADDENGDTYMQYIVNDMTSRPERWHITQDDNGDLEAHLLFPEEEFLEYYHDTDSDGYMDVDAS